MDGVEPFEREHESVPLVELEQVVRLRLDVHPDYLEAGQVVPHPGAAPPQNRSRSLGLGATYSALSC